MIPVVYVNCLSVWLMHICGYIKGFLIVFYRCKLTSSFTCDILGSSSRVCAIEDETFAGIRGHLVYRATGDLFKVCYIMISQDEKVLSTIEQWKI